MRGTPEHWRDVYNKVVKPNNADVFMHHTYYGDDVLNELSYFQRLVMQEYHKGKSVHSYPPPDLFTIFNPKTVQSERKKKYSMETFDAVKHLINHRNSLPETMIPHQQYHTDECTQMIYHGMMSQIESRKRVMQMKSHYEREGGFTYDVVILTRLDINLCEEIYIQTAPKGICAHFHSPEQIYECMFYGSSTSMNLFETYFDNLPRLFKEHCNMEHHLNQSEYFHLKYFQEQGVLIEKPPFREYFLVNANGLRRF
jgi:hypothetical protein